jgi:hypothetical protein
MSDNFRMERINKLLVELQYEVQRGFMEKEINERLGYTFIVPVSREITNGVVHCRFETRPVHRDSIAGQNFTLTPRLSVVK